MQQLVANLINIPPFVGSVIADGYLNHKGLFFKRTIFIHKGHFSLQKQDISDVLGVILKWLWHNQTLFIQGWSA